MERIVSITAVKRVNGETKGWLAQLTHDRKRYWRYFGIREFGSVEVAKERAIEWERETAERIGRGEATAAAHAKRERANRREANLPRSKAALTIRPHDERTCEYMRGWRDLSLSLRTRLRMVAEHFDRQQHLVLPTRKVAELLRDLDVWLAGGDASGRSPTGLALGRERIESILRSSSGPALR